MDTKSITGCSTNQRESQVDSEVLRLRNSVEVLMNLAASVRDRLSPVLRDEPPSQGEEDKQLECLVPVADRIQAERHRIEGVTYMLERVLERLEV